MKKTFLAVVLLIAIMLCSSAVAAEDIPAVIWSLQTDAGTVCVKSETLDGQAWLFLPACADLTALSLSTENDGVDGAIWVFGNGETTPFEPNVPINGVALATNHHEDVYSLVLAAADGSEILTLHLMKSQHLSSMHISSTDPINEGREWLEDCPLHEKTTSAHLVMLREDGSVSAGMPIDKIRGRGNTTWTTTLDKKPYQINLAYKQNLLETGDPLEARKKWVLLANEALWDEESDRSMLRNKISLDISREFGLENTSKCEYVDLYYDDCYRGTYLLCEKVEVNPGRVDVVDFDEIIKGGAKALGVYDLDRLPIAQGINRYGMEIHYPENLPEPDDPSVGGYLIEMEKSGGSGEATWFRLGDGRAYACKNPSYASERMVTYVSELMQEVYQSFENYGFDPETGMPIENIMDIDSFTRSLLIAELTKSFDMYVFTSTNFVVKAGEYKLYAGPVWDFDLATAEVETLRSDNQWSRYFYRTTVYQEAAKRLYSEELYPIVSEILLGDREGVYLKSLAEYEAQISASWLMNYYRFSSRGFPDLNYMKWLHSFVEDSAEFYEKQSAWLLSEINSWSEDEVSHTVDLELSAPYSIVNEDMIFGIASEQRSSLRMISSSVVCTKPATEEEFGTWECRMILAPKPNTSYADDLVITVNGQSAVYEHLDDGTISVLCWFVDWSYRPAIYRDVDYGTVFDFDYFIDYYPDIVDECGGDRDAALAYFVDYGMDMAMTGNEYFDPTSVWEVNIDLSQIIGDTWKLAYERYIEGQYVLSRPYEPEIFQ
ncbi:MAG: hypothetical protein GX096_09790 [Clostridiales bacterium]|nr:hypothetical protein [Clostridiales bacterium]